MRYKNGAGDQIRWQNGTWFDEGSPWASCAAEDVRYNVDVETSPAAEGA